jgi:GT2 family glycosyltransferase
MLERALRSLLAQASPPAEVIVVDNAPAGDATRRLVRDGFPEARYVCEPAPGLDVARNRALSAASHSTVAFFDDDVVLDSGWTRALFEALGRRSNTGAVTGRVEALSLETEGQRLFEANGGYDRGRRRVELPRDARRRLHGLPAPLIAWAVSLGNGSSLAVRREAALEVGGFDEALDRPPRLPGGGDMDLLWRLLEAGYDVVYEPAALARHEHRRDLEAACGQIVGHQRAQSAWLAKAVLRSSGRRRVAVLLFLLWRLVKPGARLARRAAGRDPLPARVLLRMWRECWVGAALGLSLVQPAARGAGIGSRAPTSAAAFLP